MAELSDPISDADLARRLKSREPEAMSEFYDRYGRVVYSIILRIVRNTSIAEDLTQETFLRVWHRTHLLDDKHGSLGPWLLTVARNRAIDYIRSLDAKFASHSFHLEQQDHPRLFVDMDRYLSNRDHARRLQTAFQKLNANQQQVIELAYFEGLSQTEMAAHLQQPLGTIKTWVRTALKTLREELGGAATV